MGLIDFHVHLFPDALAGKTIEKLARIAGDERGDAPHYSDATVAGTYERMDEWDVDAVVTQHIATSARSMRKVNDFAASVKGYRMYAFGSVHPEAEDALEELERIQFLGLDGVKLHPDYQNFFVDESRMAGIYEKCAQLRLPILFHAGWDPLSPDVVHAQPERLREVVAGYPELTVIAAHLGGMRRYDEVEKHLVGRKNLYLDTSMCLEYEKDAQQYARILRAHGTDRVLFATDCPWSTPQRELQMLDRVDLTAEERKDILWRNALRVLDEPVISLARVTEVSRSSIEDFAREYFAAGESVIGGQALKPGVSVEEWLAHEALYESEATVPADRVPGTTYFGVRRSDGKLVGVINVRHRLNDALLKCAGNIGYSVRPSERRKGYAKEMLRLSLKKAKALCQNDKVLLTCDENNIASARTIVSCGGVLENILDGTRRYWIKL